MIIFTHNNKDYSFRNEGHEVTLHELSKISNIMNQEKPFFIKWLDVVELLGSTSLRNVIDDDGLVQLVENFNITNISTEIQETIEVNGRTYSCNLEEGKIKLSGMDLGKIETFIRDNQVDFGGLIFAVIYKDDELTDTEHYSNAHIKHKAKLFNEHITAEIAAPVMFQVNTKMIQNIERLSKANAVNS